MAGMPPSGMGPMGAMPPRPPMSPPPMAPPTMPPPAPNMGASGPPGGLGPSAPLSGMLSDLPQHLSPGWQAIDMAIRCIRTALRAKDMQQLEKVVAVLESQANTLDKVLSAYTTGTAGGSSTPDTKGADTSAPESAAVAADADSQPSATSAASEASE